MVRLSLNNNVIPTYWFPLVLAFWVFGPGFASAESASLSCTSARTQVEHTQQILRSLENQREEIQQQVQQTYQDLFRCQTSTVLSPEERDHCTQLEEEGPKQFQSMIDGITVSHQTAQQLAQQTHQIQISCPTHPDETFAQTAGLGEF